MKKLLALWLGLVSLAGFSQTLHIRPIGGTPPYTYIVRDGNGNQTANRSSSASEESFTYPGAGYSYTVTDNAGNNQTKSVDAATAEILRIPAKSYTATFGSSADLVNHINNMPVGFNMAGIAFVCGDYFQESLPITEAERQARFDADQPNWSNGNYYYSNWWDTKLTQPWQGINNTLWTQEFDHVNNTSPGQSHPFDDVIRAAYVYKNAQAGRLGVKLLVNFGRLGNTLSDKHSRYSFSYSTAESQARPDGVAHMAPGKDYFGGFLCASFASDKALQYDQKALRNVMTRYRQAINDGTIAMIAPWFDNSGESQPVLTYRLEDGSDTRNLGDFSLSMRTKFAAHMASKFQNNVSAFNNKFSTSITAFTASQFPGDLLLNGPTLLQMHYSWFQMEAMSLFERDLKEHIHSNLNITRNQLWILEVGGLLDGLVYVRKSLNFNRRIRQQTRWIQVKSNNDINYVDYALDQITSAKRYMGEAGGMWEPSPADQNYFSPEGMSTPIASLKTQGVNLSAFIPQDAYNRWTSISTATNLASYTTRPADTDYVNLVINFKDIVTEGKYEGWAGEGKIRAAYDALRSQYPTKRVNMYVDDSSIINDWLVQ